MRVLKNALIVILLALVVMFAVQNAATVEFEFLVWSLQMPRAIVFTGIFIVGICVGWLLRLIGTRRN